jgi:hypothetical protein
MEMKLFLINEGDSPSWVVADSMGRAITKWRDKKKDEAAEVNAKASEALAIWWPESVAEIDGEVIQ